GLVVRRKKLRRLSTTRWCREADGFLDAAWRLCHKVLRQPFSKTSFTSSGLAPIASPCATRRTTRSLASWSNFPWHVRRFSNLLKRNKTWGTSSGNFSLIANANYLIYTTLLPNFVYVSLKEIKEYIMVKSVRLICILVVSLLLGASFVAPPILTLLTEITALTLTQ
ncbi:hypothetical protein, partial [Corynebacterium diphtheriae]|uniref:hypothetical protein n=2 Tax=Corynebacterium diphtheriae TaxID=1717 RepID=UPI00202CCA28